MPEFPWPKPILKCSWIWSHWWRLLRGHVTRLQRVMATPNMVAAYRARASFGAKNMMRPGRCVAGRRDWIDSSLPTTPGPLPTTPFVLLFRRWEDEATSARAWRGWLTISGRKGRVSAVPAVKLRGTQRGWCPAAAPSLSLCCGCLLVWLFVCRGCCSFGGLMGK